MTATYRALFCDLRTDQVRDAFPVSAATIEDYIGKTGTFSGSLTAPDRTTAERITDAVIPGRTAVWIERNRETWWGGIVWTSLATSTARGTPATADIQAATFDSYLDHRQLTVDLNASDADQFEIARRIVDFAQSTDGGDIGIRLDERQASGVERTRKYSRYDLPKLRDLLDKLAATDKGFEWRIRCYRNDTGERIKELQLGHPRIATARGPADTVLDFPGPVTSYRFAHDATTRATHWTSRGATTGNKRPLMSTPLYIPGAFEEGWPRLDGTSDYTSVKDKTTLTEHAKADLREAWNRTTIPEITVNLEVARLTPAILGATIRLRIADVWSQAGCTGRYRVVGYTLHAPERGQPETASLLLDAAARSDIGDGDNDEGTRALWL
ncbi:hypothetical protein P8605_04210 [Streptomyces sp. T-3]|nr:hypothetical protein [Streptomyces sp. T-3]